MARAVVVAQRDVAVTHRGKVDVLIFVEIGANDLPVRETGRALPERQGGKRTGAVTLHHLPVPLAVVRGQKILLAVHVEVGHGDLLGRKPQDFLVERGRVRSITVVEKNLDPAAFRIAGHRQVQRPVPVEVTDG